jgi:hypothetical protein
MAFPNFLFLLFIICLAALFVWKAVRPDSLSWLNLALIVILGGWCGILVWNYHSISASIDGQTQSIKLLNEGNLVGEIRDIIQQRVTTFPARIETQMFDHYYYFTGFGWMVSGSYFVILSAIYGIFRLFRRQTKSAVSQ